MKRFTHFSRHAFERVVQRTKLSAEEIARILDRGLYVNTGRRPGFDKTHLAFYSAPDNEVFVAIQDCVTGTVVTILPLEYHANLAWRISDQDCLKAKQILLDHCENRIDPQSLSNASVFKIQAHYIDAENWQKTKTIHSVDAAPYNYDIKRLLADKRLLSNIDEFANLKGILADQIFGISFRLGTHGHPITVDVIGKWRV